MDAAISKVILGHTGSTDATPGRLGGESNAAGVRDDLIKASADLVCASFNRTIAKWLTLWNFGENVPPPKVWRRVESEPDLKAQADRDKVLFDMGYKPTLQYITETYAVDVTESQQQPAPFIPGQLPQPNQPEFADAPRFTPQQQAIEDLADAGVSVGAQPVSDESIRNAIAAAHNPEDLDARLSVLFADVSRAEFTRQLERAMFAADVLGYAHADGK